MRRLRSELAPAARQVRTTIANARRAGSALRSTSPVETATEPSAPDHPADTNTPQLFPPGHYYSPIVDVSSVRADSERVFAVPTQLPGIDLRADRQLELLERFAELTADAPYGDAPTAQCRYGYVNDFFSYGDGLVLHAMLRNLAPRKYVEIGSGWSSALTLDVVDRYLDEATQCVFVEPYPDRLNSLLSHEGRTKPSYAEIIEKPVQEVDTALFDDIRAGDFLFIDSTHVSKVGSDVNHLYFEVLPCLEPGVIVHIHDIFYPFEYPADWVYQGRNWTEDYLLRAYLINNPKVEILWFNSYLGHLHRDAVASALPLWDRNPGGSLWLRTL
jgi:hypothetical protein